MAKLQSDGYERGYFHKIWMEYYCLGKNHASELLSSKFIRCQISEKIWLYRYYQSKNQLPATSSSHINLTMKLLIKLYLLHQK